MHAARKTRCVRAYERVSFVQQLFQVRYRSAPNGSLGTYFRLGSQPLTNHRSTMSQNSITISVDFFQPFPCIFVASLVLIKALAFTGISMSIYGDFFCNFSAFLSLLAYSKMIEKLRRTIEKGK